LVERLCNSACEPGRVTVNSVVSTSYCCSSDACNSSNNIYHGNNLILMSFLISLLRNLIF